MQVQFAGPRFHKAVRGSAFPAHVLRNAKTPQRSRTEVNVAVRLQRAGSALDRAVTTQVMISMGAVTFAFEIAGV